MVDKIPELLQEARSYEPETFIRSNNSLETQTLSTLKSLYDYTKFEEARNSYRFEQGSSSRSKPKSKKSKPTPTLSKTEEPLPELITESFDSDQIWEELQLQNGITYENLVTSISQLLAVSRISKQRVPQGQEQSIEEDSGSGGSDLDLEDDDIPIGSDEDEEEDDEADLEQSGGEEEDEVDLEPEYKEPDPEESICKPKLLPQKTPDADPGEADSEDPSKLSNFEKQRKKIEENIKLMEDTALEPKNWKYQGEVTGEKRPENSLLEEHLLFDHLLKQAPEITAKTTLKLEDIIKNRIKDGAWDDVIRKAKPIDNPNEYKRALVMNQEKSKLSLAQVYEQEYIESQKKADEKTASKTTSWTAGALDDSNTVPEEELKIAKDLKSLFSKLDALSNFHYTPKLPSAEIKIVTNIPSINMEEVAPISMSDATALAPQEIQDPIKGEIKSKTERTNTDKLRERRIKKKKQHLKRLAREEKARDSGLGLRNIKIADNIISGKSGKNKKKNLRSGEEESIGTPVGKELKSSKAFFHKLQEETQTLIKETLLGKRTKNSSQPNKRSELNAKKFKL